jgi:hypothetical protein
LATYQFDRLKNLSTEREVRNVMEQYENEIDGTRIALSQFKEMKKVVNGVMV